MTELIEPTRQAEGRIARELLCQYLQWLKDNILQHYSLHYDSEAAYQHDLALWSRGGQQARLYLIQDNHQSAGICLVRFHAHRRQIEIKRFFIEPAYRGQGIARRALGNIINHGRAHAYQSIILETTTFMHAAHQVYFSVGFTETTPYQGSECSSEHQSCGLFLYKAL